MLHWPFVWKMRLPCPSWMEGWELRRAITSLLIKPASAVCNLDCAYCFYLDRDADPYKSLPAAA